LELQKQLIEHKALDLLDTYSGANNHILHINQNSQITTIYISIEIYTTLTYNSTRDYYDRSLSTYAYIFKYLFIDKSSLSGIYPR